MDFYKVINLGHSPKQPLIQSSSELSDGLEPHATLRVTPDGAAGYAKVRVGGGVPGVVQEWGTRRGAIPGTNQGPDPGQIEAYFRYTKINRFIRPFDWIYD